MSSPFSLADLTDNVGLMIWAAIGAAGLLAGFVSVNVVKRRSIKNMPSNSANTEDGSQVAATSSAAESSPVRAQEKSSDYSAAFTASPSARRGKRAHLTHAG